MMSQSPPNNANVKSMQGQIFIDLLGSR